MINMIHEALMAEKTKERKPNIHKHTYQTVTKLNNQIMIILFACTNSLSSKIVLIKEERDGIRAI